MITVYREDDFAKEECRRAFELLSEIQEDTGIDFDEVRHHLYHVYDGVRELELWRKLVDDILWVNFWDRYDNVAQPHER